MSVVKQCANCKFYNPLQGEPPAGQCQFIEMARVPYWMENYKTTIDKLGADVMGRDGDECAAFEPGI